MKKILPLKIKLARHKMHLSMEELVSQMGEATSRTGTFVAQHPSTIRRAVPPLPSRHDAQTACRGTSLPLVCQRHAHQRIKPQP